MAHLELHWRLPRPRCAPCRALYSIQQGSAQINPRHHPFGSSPPFPPPCSLDLLKGIPHPRSTGGPAQQTAVLTPPPTAPGHLPWRPMFWAMGEGSPPLQSDSTTALTQDSLLCLWVGHKRGVCRGQFSPTHVYGVAPVSPESSGEDWPTRRKSPSSTPRRTDAASCQLWQDRVRKGGDRLGANPQPWECRARVGGGDTKLGRNSAQSWSERPRWNLHKRSRRVVTGLGGSRQCSSHSAVTP